MTVLAVFFLRPLCCSSSCVKRNLINEGVTFFCLSGTNVGCNTALKWTFDYIKCRCKHVACQQKAVDTSYLVCLLRNTQPGDTFISMFSVFEQEEGQLYFTVICFTHMVDGTVYFNAVYTRLHTGLTTVSLYARKIDPEFPFRFQVYFLSF